MTPAGYEPLATIMQEALAQTATGKGAERHGNGASFAEQPMQHITRMVGLGFPLGQCIKKTQEAHGMASRGETDAARRELLGVIVYAAGAVLALEGTVEARNGSARYQTAQDTAEAASGAKIREGE